MIDAVAYYLMADTRRATLICRTTPASRRR